MSKLFKTLLPLRTGSKVILTGCKGTKIFYAHPSPKPIRFCNSELYFLIDADFIEEVRSD